MKIYGWKNSSNVQKVLWCCAELNLPYELIGKGGSFGGHKEADYLRLNPNGLLPTLVDGDFVLWESNAIIRYLSSQHGQGSLWPTDTRQRANADRWMDWQQTAVRDAITPVFLGMVRKKPEERDMASINAARDRLAKAFQILDDHLSRNTFVAGSKFTMGDIPLGPHVYRWYMMDIKRENLPNLKAWYDRLLARPAYKQHVMIGLG